MKSTHLLLAGAAAILVAAPAQAREGQPYFGVNGGIIFADQVDIEAETYQEGLNEARVNTGYGWEGDLVFGYDFGAFRLEGELAYKKQDHDRLLVNSANTAGLPVGLRANPDSSQKTYSGMINALFDLGGDDGLQFFAGGGAGLARLDFELGVPGTGTLIEGKDTTFAYQGLAGLR